MPRKLADPDLVMVTIRLRQSDIKIAKAIAKGEGTLYQRWIRNRIGDAVRAPNGSLKVYKFMGVGASAVVRAHTADEARTIAADYAKALEAKGSSPIATLWIARSAPVEVPSTVGVVAWTEMGTGSPMPPRTVDATRSRRRGRRASSRR